MIAASSSSGMRAGAGVVALVLGGRSVVDMVGLTALSLVMFVGRTGQLFPRVSLWKRAVHIEFTS
jgi:hypothetical protein